jgi:hypothetical protein
MATNYHMRISGLSPGSSRPGDNGWVTVHSLSLENVNQIVTVMPEGVLNVPLIQSVAAGRFISEVVIFMEGRPAGAPNAIMLFSNVLFNSYQGRGSLSGEIPLDTFSFSYQKLEYLSVVQYLSRKGAAAATEKLKSWFR